MSKDSMRFQSSHSRNGYTWHFEKSITGRLILNANNEGVRKTCGLIVTAMGRYGRLTKQMGATYLFDNFHESFTVNDLSSVFRQLVKHDIATNNGDGSFSLTPNGANLWRSIDKEWV